ncbi:MULTISPECIES: hypothetical protein [Nocardiaceae]|uniref:DUF732 domain-containing protein n=1 Tax=Rhodococcoides corynebacterioides TaxID=53972 RepID=A0ABS2KV41_9NOCA|nr:MULTISPECIES: hypothetical protein [Rhodococcus]MBM7415686.1 hypothetical protein [Rhodococcus corynebacterioides]MBP1118148.1 hypothetical protein [Rhodococcus sp. PvP016]
MSDERGVGRKRIGARTVVVVVGAALVLLLAGIGVASLLDDGGSDDSLAGGSAYEACVEDAASHLNSVTGISMEQARLQASTSPNCGPMAPSPVVVPTTQSVRDELYPDGFDESRYTKLFAELCKTTYNDIPKWRALNALEKNYTPEQAELLYEDALRTC